MSLGFPLEGPCSEEDNVGVFVDYFCECWLCQDDHTRWTLLLLEVQFPRFLQLVQIESDVSHFPSNQTLTFESDAVLVCFLWGVECERCKPHPLL